MATVAINGIYVKPTDDVVGLATITTTGTQRGSYAPSLLAGANLMKPAKVTNTGSVTFVFAFPAAQRIDLIGFTNHNLDDALAVSFQGAAASSFASVAISASMTIPPARLDGTKIAPWADLTGLSGYTTTGYQYWRINITGTNSIACSLSRVVLGKIFGQFSPRYDKGVESIDTVQFTENLTAFGVRHTYDLQVRDRSLTATFTGTPDTQLAALNALWQSAHGHAQPWLFIPDQRVQDARFVLFVDGSLKTKSRTVNRTDVTFAVDEVRRFPLV